MVPTPPHGQGGHVAQRTWKESCMAHAPAGGHRGMSAKAATGDGGMTDGRLENGRVNGRLGNGRLGVSAMAVTRRNGLRLPERMPLTTWRRIGDQIALIGNASAWWLGD